MPNSDLTKSDTGLGTSTTFVTLYVIALGPDPIKTPWWARLSGEKYTHIAVSIGDELWDQPMGRPVRWYGLREWLMRKRGRPFCVLMFTVADDDWHQMLIALQLYGKKASSVKTALRYLGLWPKPVWNCCAMVREVLGIYGIHTTGETPHAIVKDLSQSRSMAANLGTASDDGRGVH